MEADFYLQKYSEASDLDEQYYYIITGLSKFPDNVELRYEYSKYLAVTYDLRQCLQELELIDKLSPNYKDIKNAMEMIRKRLANQPMRIYG